MLVSCAWLLTNEKHGSWNASSRAGSSRTANECTRADRPRVDSIAALTNTRTPVTRRDAGAMIRSVLSYDIAASFDFSIDS